MPPPPDGQLGTVAGFAGLIEPYPIGRLRAQDHRVFGDLIDRQYRPVHRYLARLIGDVEVAADLTQETFLRAYLALPRLADGSNVVGWLFRIATNLARQHHRHRRLIGWSHLSGLETHQLLSHGPEDDVTRRDLIDSALAQLPLDQRSCLLLYAWTGYSCAEIGEIVGKSTAAVRMLLMRARRRFRTAYGDPGDFGLPGGAVPDGGDASSRPGAPGRASGDAAPAQEEPPALMHQHPADLADTAASGAADCRAVQEVILFYPRGDLSRATFAAVTRHLVACMGCACALAEVQTTYRRLQGHLRRAEADDPGAARAAIMAQLGAPAAMSVALSEPSVGALPEPSRVKEPIRVRAGAG